MTITLPRHSVSSQLASYTSSSTMSFTMYQLAINPGIQERLRYDITRVLKKHNSELTYGAIQEMKYLDMVVNEEMVEDYKRYNNRKSWETENIAIERKEMAGIWHPRLFKSHKLQLGMHFGLMTTKTGLIRILLNYEVAPCEDTPIPLVLNKKAFSLATSKFNYSQNLYLTFDRGTTRLHTNYRISTMVFFGPLAVEVAALFSFVFLALYFYFTRNFNFWKKRGVPYVKPLPFLGSLKYVTLQKLSIGQQLKKFYDDYQNEPYVGIISTDQPGLIIRDLDFIKNILVKDFQSFMDHLTEVNENVDPLLARSLFLSNGQKWKHMRINLSPTFTSGKMKNMFYLLENCAKVLDDYLDKECARGSPVEIREAAAKFTTDVIASCTFGIDSNTLKDPKAEFRQRLRKIFEFTPLTALAGYLSFFAPKILNVLRISIIQPDVNDFCRRTLWETAKYRKEHGIVRQDFVDNLMELKEKHEIQNGSVTVQGSRNISKKEHGIVRQDFVDNLMELKEKHEIQNGSVTVQGSRNIKFVDEDYAAQAFQFLTAGFETSSSTMSYTLYQMALNPEIQKRLSSEIREVLQKNNNQISYDVIQDMKYLDMVVSGMRFGLMQTKTGLIHILSRYEVSPCKDTPIPLVFDTMSFLHSTRSIPLSDPVEIKEAAAKFTTDVIASCAFGIDSNTLKDPNSEFRLQLRKVFAFSPLASLAVFLSFFAPKILNVLRIPVVKAEVNDFVRKTLWDTAKYRYFVDDDYVALAMSFLTAGFETSSSTISFTLYQMALNPDIQRRLSSEIRDILQKNNNQVSYDVLQEIKYLHMVISETLRLYPILPFLDRKCTADYQLPAPSGKGNITIPVGTAVYVPLLGIHHDPKYFPNPEKYDPERFTEENKLSRPAYSYMPFGEGPRICIGMRFGLMQTKVGLIHILSKYEVSPCKDTPIPLLIDNKSFTFAKIIGLFAIVFLGLYFYFTRNFNFWKKRGVKFVKPSPFLGSLKDKRGVKFVKPSPFLGSLKDVTLQRISIGHQLKKLYDDYKNEPFIGIISIDQPALMITDLNIIKNVLVKDSQNFLDHLTEMSETVDPLFAKSAPVEIKEVTAKFTTDVIASCALGIDSNSLKDPNAEFRHQLRKVFDFTPIKSLAFYLAFFAPKILKTLRIRIVDSEVYDFVRRTLWDTAKHR
ncbi:hypothetical protein C0J52_26426 [Blattella germanica]|nr:hypothetical protein C0J52_26426 [Blattella germanica]